MISFFKKKNKENILKDVSAVYPSIKENATDSMPQSVEDTPSVKSENDIKTKVDFNKDITYEEYKQSVEKLLESFHETKSCRLPLNTISSFGSNMVFYKEQDLGKYYEDSKKKLDRASCMEKWSVSFHKEDRFSMAYSVYWPYNEQDGIVTSGYTNNNPAWGDFYTRYSHIATKYGSRMGGQLDISQSLERYRDFALDDSVKHLGTIFHLCMECYDVKFTMDGCILYLRDFRTKIETLPVDFISPVEANDLRGRMCAFEVAYNFESGCYEILWIRKLRFNKDGFVMPYKSAKTYDEYHVELWDEPSLSDDYEKEYGYRYDDSIKENSISSGYKVLCKTARFDNYVGNMYI